MYKKSHTILFILFVIIAVVCASLILFRGRALSAKKDQEKILESAREIAWPEGTDEELWDYETGDFKDPKTREMFNEIGYSGDEQYDYTVCGHFVDLVVYRALAVRTCLLPEDVDADYAELPKELEIVHEGKIRDFPLQPGDIIRYKKIKASNGHHSEHALVYCGGDDKLVAESGICIRYPVIRSALLEDGTLKWDSDEVLVDTLQVIRPGT